MSVDLSAFVKSIQRKLGDTSTATESLIEDFVGDRLVDYLTRFQPIEMRDLVDFTTVASTRAYTLTGWGEYSTSDIYAIKEPTQGITLRKMALKRYEELIASPSSETGDPTHYIPVTDTKFYLYPAPNSATVLSTYIVRTHAAMTADSSYFELADRNVKTIKFGVLADLYADRDDTRSVYYERKYEKGLKDAMAKERQNLNDNARLLPGNSIE